MYKILICLLLCSCTINNVELTINESVIRQGKIEKVVKECNTKGLKLNPTPPPPVSDLMKSEDNYSLKTKILLSYITELKLYIKQIKTQVINFKCD